MALAGDSIQAALHILKAYTSLYYLASAVLVYLIARRLTPGRELFAAALYAWNPFVVLRIAGNGHNDVTMFLFVLVALWAMVGGRWRYVLPLLVASALIKYVSLMLVAPMLVAGYLQAQDHRLFWKETAIGAGLALLLTVVTLAPFWAGSDTFEIAADQGEKFITSTPLLIREQLRWEWSVAEGTATDVSRWEHGCLFGLFYLGALFALWRERGRPLALIACMALMLLLFNLIAVTWYRPWYMLWPLTLLPFLPGRWPLALVFAISVGGMTPDIIEQYRGELEFFREHYQWAISAPVIAAFLPATLVLVAGWIATRRLLLSDDPRRATADT